MRGTLGKMRRLIQGAWSRARSPEGVFTEIYRKNHWGGKPGEICSGGGSSDSRVVSEYVGLLEDHADRFGFREMRFVDLGCGDMNVGKRLIPLCRSYVGADVVRYVIAENRSAFSGSDAGFVHCDIVKDQLPDGEVCFLRQVLQHLSNDQIQRILPKLRKYRFVYISEHIPAGWTGARANLDKPQGRGIRLDRNSGVDITREPFGISNDGVEVVLEVAGNPHSSGLDPGVIRTVLYRPDKGSLS